jgi:hypothetical protein
MTRHHDRDRRRRAPGGLGSRRHRGDDHVDMEPDQLVRERGKAVDPVPVVSALDDDVLALGVSKVPQPLEERLPDVPRFRARRPEASENADSKHPRRRLRAGHPRTAEQRQEAQQRCAATDHSITVPLACGATRHPDNARCSRAYSLETPP